MAWRMQSAVPELCDIGGETEATKKLYGLDDAGAEDRPPMPGSACSPGGSWSAACASSS